MGWAGKRRSATRPRDGPDRGLKAHGYRHTVAPRPGRRIANRPDRDRSPVAAGGARRHRGSLHGSSPGPSAASRDGSRSGEGGAQSSGLAERGIEGSRGLQSTDRRGRTVSSRSDDGEGNPMGWAGKRRSATRPRDGPDRGLKPTANPHTVAPRPGRRLANRPDRDRSPVAVGGARQHRGSLHGSSPGPRAASRDGSRSATFPARPPRARHAH